MQSKINISVNLPSEKAAKHRKNEEITLPALVRFFLQSSIEKE